MEFFWMCLPMHVLVTFWHSVFDTFFDTQCFCSTPKGSSKSKVSVSLSKISKEVGSSNSIQLEGALDEIKTEFVLASVRNLGYYALELVDGEIMKFESNGRVSIESTIKVFQIFIGKYICFQSNRSSLVLVNHNWNIFLHY